MKPLFVMWSNLNQIGNKFKLCYHIDISEKFWNQITKIKFRVRCLKSSFRDLYQIWILAFLDLFGAMAHEKQNLNSCMTWFMQTLTSTTKMTVKYLLKSRETENISIVWQNELWKWSLHLKKHQIVMMKKFLAGAILI